MDPRLSNDTECKLECLGLSCGWNFCSVLLNRVIFSTENSDALKISTNQRRVKPTKSIWMIPAKHFTTAHSIFIFVQEVEGYPSIDRMPTLTLRQSPPRPFM